MEDSTRECHWRSQGIFITVPEYGQILRIQGGKCALCGEEQSAIRHALCVEHCHETGIIRGLVCKRCNNMLAWVEKHKLLNKIERFLQTNVFEDYKNNITETKEGKSLRSK